jgi:ribosome-associated toxin RatA of RatAB toxin-antitoxin module
MSSPALVWLAACVIAAAAPDATPPVSSAPCIACRAPALDPSRAFSHEEWLALEDGEVLRRHETAERSKEELAGGAHADSLIARSPAQVWAVLTDFERWPAFMPLVEKTQVARRDGSRMWVAQQFSVMFVSMGHTTIYELDAGDGRLTWQLDEAVPHDIASSQGSWQLVPVADGHETLVRYVAQMRAGRAVPEFVEGWLRERSLEKLLTSLRSEVLRRYPEP